MDSSEARQQHKAAGRCGCGRQPIAGLKLCSFCRKAHKKKILAYVAEGKCWCGRERDDKAFKRCSVCRQAVNQRNRKIKLEVIAAYGGKCQCPGGCEVTEFDWLSVDHINGGGVQHRKTLKTIGCDFYRWLKRMGFPKDEFRLLCYNCNLSRGHLGACPHEIFL